MNNFTPFNQLQSFQPYQPAQFFPQPQGGLYMIGSAAEIANIPVNTGLSAAISLRENALYLKTFSNGAPAVLGYKLVPLDSGLESQPQSQPQAQPQPQPQQDTQEQEAQDKKIIAAIEDYEKRITALEDLLTIKGGRIYGTKPKSNAVNDAT